MNRLRIALPLALLLMLVGLGCGRVGAETVPDCVDIAPPNSVGPLVLNLAPSPEFEEEFKPKARANSAGWFDAKPFTYRVEHGVVTIIQFTPKDYAGCVTFKGESLEKSLSVVQFGKILKNCAEGPKAEGRSFYQCPGFDMQQSSAIQTWPNPSFRIDRETLRKFINGLRTDIHLPTFDGKWYYTHWSDYKIKLYNDKFSGCARMSVEARKKLRKFVNCMKTQGEESSGSIGECTAKDGTNIYFFDDLNSCKGAKQDAEDGAAS